ncbi:hypothetical protein J437_LFUL017216 [Ladona fulva]|uniref:N-acetyltransferase domain-containing protein n=1 Tax=Ladona fulva TaxID=123851 RepID=A0A8K0KKD0_LADFU|nr:hypothetical protein J437_LFUL017216 [Ladona fulva]
MAKFDEAFNFTFSCQEKFERLIFTMKKVIFREAKRDDCDEVRRLIQELADFEKMPNGPQIDAEVLREDGFSDHPPSFGCIVMEEVGEGGIKGKLCGYAVYFISYSTWLGKAMYLEDIYVSPEYRGNKYGSKLFDLVAKKGLDMGCKRMDFRALNWNPAIEFYKRKGAVDVTKSEGWHNFTLDVVGMQNLAAKSSTRE